MSKFQTREEKGGMVFEQSYEELPKNFYAKVLPERFPSPQLLQLNEDLLSSLGIAKNSYDKRGWLDLCSGRSINSTKVAMAYAGHQFGHFVPSLGDGRALLLGEVLDEKGCRYDIQLKGSGSTPFSRGGDGKSWLGAVLREYLVSEGMFYLGIPTTRSLAIVTTGETIYRERAEQGAVLTRVAASHIRIGTFQFFASKGDKTNLGLLLQYACNRHGIKSQDGEPLWLALLFHVRKTQAYLIAAWMLKGFIHGVMNTDNVLISGETIDYGPCAFMDEFHPMKVFSSIDANGRYAFGNQPQIGAWNLMRLADCLLLLAADGDGLESKEKVEAELEHFATDFQQIYEEGLLKKLGITSKDDKNGELVFWLSTLMMKHEADYTMTFRYLSEVSLGDEVSKLKFLSLFSGDVEAELWLKKWGDSVGKDGESDRQMRMKQVNPLFIPRNHRIAEAITAMEMGDKKPFDRLCKILQTPYDTDDDFADLAVPPREDERVKATFCGT